MPKQIGIMLILISTVAVLIACGTTQGDTGALTQTSNTNSQQATQPAKQQHFKVGDKVAVASTWQVTILNFRVVQPGEFDTIKDGDQFVAFDVSVTNTTNTEQDLFGAAKFGLKDSTGQSYDTTIVSSLPSEPASKVEATGLTKGTIAFEVPKSQKAFNITFDNNAFDGGTVIWDVIV